MAAWSCPLNNYQSVHKILPRGVRGIMDVVIQEMLGWEGGGSRCQECGG